MELDLYRLGGLWHTINRRNATTTCGKTNLPATMPHVQVRVGGLFPAGEVIKTDALCAGCFPGDKLFEVTDAIADATDHGVFERILEEIKQHDIDHPDHGVGCACHDAHSGALKRSIIKAELPEKSLRNLLVVFGYVQRTPPYKL